MLNNYCNLACPYCFIPKNSERINITDENMRTFIFFLKKSGIRQLRMLGGEPLLHPHFEKYVRAAINDPFFESILIFTNATILSHTLADSIVSPKTEFLINLNHPDVIDQEVFITTLNNISVLRDVFHAKRLPVKIRLGLNIFTPDFDFEYIIKASVGLSIYGIRFSLTVPVTVGEIITQQQYRKFIPRLMQFLDACYENQIFARIDCNNIPPCLYTEDQMRNLIALSNHDVCNKQRCFMPMDVTPGLDVTRCFPFFETCKTNITYFDNANELVKYFALNIDAATFEKPTFAECSDCSLYLKKKCQGGCLSYKFRKSA